MSSRSHAIAGYGLCLSGTNGPRSKGADGDYRIFEELEKRFEVSFGTWHIFDDVGAYLAVAFTETDWDDPVKLNVTKPDDADNKLRSVLTHVWAEQADLAKRYQLPKPEEAALDWFLYCYHW